MYVCLVAVVGLDRKSHLNSALMPCVTLVWAPRVGFGGHRKECRNARPPTGARAGLGEPRIGSRIATPPTPLNFRNYHQRGHDTTGLLRIPGRRIFVVVYILGAVYSGLVSGLPRDAPQVV